MSTHSGSLTAHDFRRIGRSAVALARRRALLVEVDDRRAMPHKAARDLAKRLRPTAFDRSDNASRA